MKVLSRFLLLLTLGVQLTSCASKTWRGTYKPLKEVTPPTYQSPLQALRLFKTEIESRGLIEKAKKGTLTNSETFFLSIAIHLAQRQQELETKLEKDGMIDILPRIPYAFTLESFCVQPNKSSPVSGDGLSLSESRNALRGIVREIVTGYSRNGVSRERAQLLIWSIESGLKFDEIRPDLQEDLLRISPDAHLELGNSSLNKLGQELWNQLKPAEIASLERELDKAREFGEAHEAKPQPLKDKEMDLFNNEIGFHIGTRLGKQVSNREILAATRKAIENKQVRIVREN